MKNDSKPTRAQKLAAAAQAAADVRAYDVNPDVIAYKIERLRSHVDRLVWTGLVLGLLFTMANVQQFAAAGAIPYSTQWWIAWLLDPMVSLVLVGVLLGEQVIARHGIVAGAWVRRAKWCALAMTYAMNTWSSWASGEASAILLHSVPPIMVFVAAEAVTTLRLQITEAVRRAYEAAVRTDPAPVELEPVRSVQRTYVFRTAPHAVQPQTVRLARTFAFTPVPAVQPVRIIRRQFTFAAAPPTDRAGFIRKLTGEILAAASRNDRWGPDYTELMARTGRSKSWCEKAVREARDSVFRTAEVAA